MAKKSNKLDTMRHSAAHVLAMAVLKLYPKAKPAIGPTIKDGFYYDFDFPEPISENDLSRIEKEMEKFVRKKIPFEKTFLKRSEAKKLYKDNLYKLELINEIEGSKISFYRTGDFLDLCRGPHVTDTGKIGVFKVTHLAGAYWRGSERNPMLTRIYGTAFPAQKKLDQHLKRIEEIKQRDHRKLGKELDLFTFSDEVGAGLPLWAPKGTIVRDELEKWAKEVEKEWGYVRVTTPHITKRRLYEISGHLPYYAEEMYSPIDIEGEEYYLKPMNCPHHHMIYKSKTRSYRELPLRLAEYGQLYRFERSGTLHGLMRTRGFCQNDAHIYVQPEKAVEEFILVFKMHQFYYMKLGIKDWWVVLGLRDPKNLKKKYHGDEKMWKEAEKMTKEAIKKVGARYVVDKGGAVHYGPKTDIFIKSVIGKEYAIGTDQLDLYMPQQFNLRYTDKDGKEKMPYIIHRAPLGSHERMIGFLIEHFTGAFPVWLAPVQVVIIPVSGQDRRYGQKVEKKLKEARLRVELDSRDRTMQARIRDAQLQKIPYMLIVGNKESKAETVSVRLRDGRDLGSKKINVFVKKVSAKILTKGLQLW